MRLASITRWSWTGVFVIILLTITSSKAKDSNFSDDSNRMLNDTSLPSGRCEDLGRPAVMLSKSNIGLRSLHIGIVENDHATCLTFSDNAIDRIDTDTFSRLSYLLYLDLARNRIPFCDLLSFGGHATLRTLILDKNEPSPIHDDKMALRVISRADCFPRLEHLYIRENALHGLTFSLSSSFPRLTRLYASDNRAQTAESFLVDAPTSLTHLYLERNRLRRFDARDILRNLAFLFLDGNEITRLCRDLCPATEGYVRLRGAGKLQFLSLSRNDIVEIDADTFKDACDLTSLNLSRNRIGTIKAGTFDHLTRLTDLSLSNNQLIILPDFRGTTGLVSLYLDHNRITSLTAGSFRGLSALKWLSLADNRISTVEVDALRGLISLEELDLSGNRLVLLPSGWMMPQLSLRKLDVRSNLFVRIADMNLFNAPLLEYIYAQNNYVSYVGARDLYGLHENVVVYLNNQCEMITTIRRTACYERCDAAELYG